MKVRPSGTVPDGDQDTTAGAGATANHKHPG